MTPDQQIELYRAARSIAWSYRLQDYTAAALKDLQRIVDKSKGSIIDRFENQLGAIQREDSYTRNHYQNSLAELERLSLGLRNQLGEQLTTSTSKIGALALKEWGENLSVGGVAKMVNTVALSPEQFAAFFKRNPPAGILIPKVMKNALDQGVTARIEGELLDVLREGALTGQSYKRIVDKLEESFTDFNRHQLTTLTRTFFQTANAQAFDAVYQANQDIMEGKIWTNVNDDRVCLLCLPLGEVLYKKGDPHPPMPRHPNCRCVFRAKTVSYRSLGIDVDELEEVAAPVVTRGYEKNGKWIIPPAGTGTGRRPRAVSFYQGGMKEAFPNLPEAQQKAMLGVGRYNKYKAGDLTIDQLVDKQTGKLWLLKEIEQGMHLGVPDVPKPSPIPSQPQSLMDIIVFGDEEAAGNYDSLFNKGSEWQNSLSGKQKTALQFYRDEEGFILMNKALRSGNFARVKRPIVSKIGDLEMALDNTALPEGLRIYRGMDIKASDLAGLDLKPGSVFVEDGFMSASPSSSIAGRFSTPAKSGNKGILFDLKIDKDVKGAYISESLEAPPEVLLQHGMVIRIDLIQELEEGVSYIKGVVTNGNR